MLNKFLGTIELVVSTKTEMDFELLKGRLSYQNIDGGKLLVAYGDKVHSCNVEMVNDIEWVNSNEF